MTDDALMQKAREFARNNVQGSIQLLHDRAHVVRLLADFARAYAAERIAEEREKIKAPAELLSRCLEIRDWHVSGHLKLDGEIRRLAATMPVRDESLRIRLAEDKTEVDALDWIINHASERAQEDAARPDRLDQVTIRAQSQP